MTLGKRHEHRAAFRAEEHRRYRDLHRPLVLPAHQTVGYAVDARNVVAGLRCDADCEVVSQLAHHEVELVAEHLLHVVLIAHEEQIAAADDVQQVFRDEFDFMVRELAHDLAVSITPQPGYNISGVYGVPDGLMGWQNERTVKITIPTVFLSSKGGAM